MNKHCYILWILSVLLLCSGKVFGQSCTEIQAGKTNVNIRLTDNKFLDINDTTLHDCVRECMALAHCKSYNYGQDNKVCELNNADSTDVTVDKFEAASRYIYSDISAWPKSILGPCGNHKCSGTQRCIPAKDGGYTCVDTDCEEKLPVGFYFVDAGTVTLGSVRAYKVDCPQDTYWNGVHNTTCGIYQKWSQVNNYCRGIHTCLDVKQCNPNHSDGEYWLYPEVLGGEKVRLFCHGLDTQDPAEYLTVDPDNNISNNIGASSSTNAFKSTTKFSKIRVNIEDMSVLRNNRTFSVSTGYQQKFTNYASAASCNCYGSCRGGTFVISTVDTGFKFKTIKWKKYGYNAYLSHPINSNSANTTKSATCGGYCGGCGPSEALILYIDENTAVDEGSATFANCI